MNRKIHTLALAALVALAASCGNPKNVPYFQDAEKGAEVQASVSDGILLKPGDKISIIVNTRDARLASMFNLPYTTKILGQDTETAGSSYSQGVAGYLVDSAGDIDFPVVGKIRVAGLTRAGVAALVKDRLYSENYLNDAVVTVDYMNLSVSVMGEVARPGRYIIDKDTYTILDALSVAGDLTIFGKRENVKVLRRDGDVNKTYEINLCSAQDVYSSPVFYLQQGDIIYVEPNKVKARQSTVNGNNVLSTSFWISVASLASTLMLTFMQLGVFGPRS